MKQYDPFFVRVKSGSRGKYLDDIVVGDIGDIDQPQCQKCLFSLSCTRFFLSFYTHVTLWLANVTNYNVTQVFTRFKVEERGRGRKA